MSLFTVDATILSLQTEFWEHSRSHIKEDKVLQCPKCPFVTEYKHHLEYHLRNHFGSKPFKCPKCNYACVNKSMLNSHMKSHTNVYQYRCADCTYATKYCHSLKLHLKKYNHKPATVLNADGSLPTDGSGDFELVSKRGPPRGPRGPRKDSKSPPVGTNVVLPNQGVPSPRAAAAAINGMMMPSIPAFWPFMGAMPNGMHPPPPMMPSPMHMPGIPGMSPLNIQVPPEHHRMMQSLHSGERPGLDRTISPSISKDIRCVMCSFTAENRLGLNRHMLKVHAAENQDLFNMFGIHHEALMEEAAKNSAEIAAMTAAAVNAAALQARPMVISPKKELQDEQPEIISRPSLSPGIKQELKQHDREELGRSPPGQLDEQGQVWLRALQATGGIPSKEMLQQMQQMKFNPLAMAKHLTAKERYNMALAMDMAASIEAESRVNGETPLDLTKPPISQPMSDMGPLAAMGQLGAMGPLGAMSAMGVMGRPDMVGINPLAAMQFEYMARSQKRPLPQDESSMSPQSQNASHSDPATPAPSTSPTPRKRSRKGKAYKLDTICMKLQERYDEEEEPGKNEGYGDSDEYMSEMGGDKGEGGETSKASEGSISSQPSPAEADDGKENEPEININQIHNSLRELNNDSPSCDQKYPGENSDDTAPQTPPRSSEATTTTTFSSSINRRKLFMMRHAEEQVQEVLRHQLEVNGRDAMMRIDPMNMVRANPELAKNGDTYECSHCEILFRDCIMYTMHMGYHGYQDPFKCNMCGSLSKNRVEFFLHIARAAHD